jgi:Putative ABC-transporter type IV
MLSIYALIQPLFERAHNQVRDRPALLRAAVYGVGFMAVEYAAGQSLRILRGRAPWDYSYARRHIDGLVRLDYFFLWAAAGLALEGLHDRLDDKRQRVTQAPVPRASRAMD